MRKILLPAIVIIFICSCKREYQCANQGFSIAFIGYQQPDLDSFVVRRFTANTNFQQLLDSSVNTPQNDSYVQEGDTITVLYVAPNMSIQYGNDWQVYAPHTGKTISIANIMAEQKSGSCTASLFGEPTHCTCTNAVQSAAINGQLITYPRPDSTFKGYTVYFKN